ncbi:MAG TPA: twin-arginine translocase TatA/TatE family subunit [Bacteroidota bacterium]|nr:twin-arginine translocase TatA/TatE family subunit [Bacteroidota bacterium]
MFGSLGTGEIILILLIVLIFFGAKKIPELAQGLGKGLREFRKATRDIQDEVERTDEQKTIDRKKIDETKIDQKNSGKNS